MTIKELYDACAEMIAKGAGDKEIIFIQKKGNVSLSTMVLNHLMISCLAQKFIATPAGIVSKEQNLKSEKRYMC